MSTPASLPVLPAGYRLRPPLEADSAAVIALIDGCYREYGDRVHLTAYDLDLTDLPKHYLAAEKPFVVAEHGPTGEVVGTHAVVPDRDAPGITTFRRLYVAAPHRGSGLGEALMLWAESEARRLGRTRVEFWSDVRFARAHTFFRRLGYVADGRTRVGHDSWTPYTEAFFAKDL